MTNRFIVRLIVFALVILFGVSACQVSAPPHMPSPLESGAGLETQSSTAFPLRRPPASGQARPATCGFKLLRTEVHSSNTLVTRYVREMPTGDRWFIWLEFRVPSTGQLAYRIGRRMSIDAVAAYDDFDCYGAVANLPSECPCNIPPADAPIDPPFQVAKLFFSNDEGIGLGGGGGGARPYKWGRGDSGTNSWSGAATGPKGFTSGTARTNLNNMTTTARPKSQKQSPTREKKVEKGDPAVGRPGDIGGLNWNGIQLKNFMNNLNNKSRGQIENDLMSMGLKLHGNSTNPQFKTFLDSNNNVRAMIHGPHKNTSTKYDHLHIFDRNGMPLDKNLTIQPTRSADVHHQIPPP